MKKTTLTQNKQQADGLDIKKITWWYIWTPRFCDYTTEPYKMKMVKPH
jgi:hypothetical protein